MSQEIESVLKEKRVFPPSSDWSANAHVKSLEEYETLYRRSLEDPEGFWGEQAEKHIAWFKKWDSVLDCDFSRVGTSERPYLSFFKGAKLNVSYNCLDRHLEGGRGNKPAIIWQGED